MDLAMEESNGVQLEENKAITEKNKGRQFKSREQLQGLEDFYNEHKYPNESMKVEIAIKLNLTEKQVSGWFCHRRLKDKRMLEEESHAPRKLNLSSSNLKQDSFSSTKRADYKRVDLREVVSLRFSHENLLIYQKRSFGDGDDMSSESNSAQEEIFYPQNRSNLGLETTEYRTSNGFIQHSSGREGPSGYLKIKGQTENAAITAVKRQLGKYYRVDGPSLGIEFDSLPPEAFEPSTVWNDDLYEAPQDLYMHKSDTDKLSYRLPKETLPFMNHSSGFPDEKHSYSDREISDYNSSRNLGIQRKHDLPGMRSESPLDHVSHSYNGKRFSCAKDALLPVSNYLNPKVDRQRKQFSFMPVDVTVGHKVPIHTDVRFPSNGMRKANKRGREEILDGDYTMQTSSRDAAPLSKQIKGPTEVPSSFSEVETAETSSSMD